MKKHITRGVFALTIGLATSVAAEPGKQPEATPAATPQKAGVTPKTQPEGTRLPGRDCKLYEGETRQHRFPQYEIGNPNRPGCKA